MAGRQNMRRENNGEINLMEEVRGVIATNGVNAGIKMARFEKKVVNIVEENNTNVAAQMLEMQQKVGI